MKLNLKVIIAIVVIIGATVWAVDSVRSRSYSGTAFTFSVGHGAVTLVNSSDAAVPVQLVGTGSRSFTVATSMDGVAGTSERVGTGRTTTQLFEFSPLPGSTNFTVTGGTDVNFNAAT